MSKKKTKKKAGIKFLKDTLKKSKKPKYIKFEIKFDNIGYETSLSEFITACKDSEIDAQVTTMTYIPNLQWDIYVAKDSLKAFKELAQKQNINF